MEYLGQGVNLDMIFIPAGSFMMGSQKSEKGREKNENPRHAVALKIISRFTPCPRYSTNNCPSVVILFMLVFDSKPNNSFSVSNLTLSKVNFSMLG